MDISFPAILHGADYNPEQWPESVWDDDIRLMREAHVNVATLPVFGWVSLEPEEGRYTFDWLDRIVEKLWAGGIHLCMATATASVPAWLTQQYPDVLRVDIDGRRQRHGMRHTFCPNSANFRRLSTALAGQIAARYASHPGLVVWHVGNEYGNPCYCDICGAAFRVWLQGRYGHSLDEVNARWSTRFWGHTYTNWEQIEPPTTNGERSIQAQMLDYDRFQSDSLLACFIAERDVLRAYNPNIPITTNLMGTFKALDYHAWAREMDIVSWDSYPAHRTPPAETAFAHSLMRGLKEGQSWMLMEQTPSQVNWQAYNPLKPPGLMRLLSYQAIAHGADSVMYFQWRRSRGGPEKFHGAVVEHAGVSEARVFQEVASLAAELAALGTRTLGGGVNSIPPGRCPGLTLSRPVGARGTATGDYAMSPPGRCPGLPLSRPVGAGSGVPGRAAVLFDWDNWRAIEYSQGPTVDLKYVPLVREYFAALHSLGIAADVVSPGADLSPYALVVAPLLYMVKPGVADALERFVADGGSFVTTCFSGIVDETDIVYPGGYPGPLRNLLGIWVEETDVMALGESIEVVFDPSFSPFPGGERGWGRGVESLAEVGVIDGDAHPTIGSGESLSGTHRAGLLCDRVHLEGAQALATFTQRFYAGEPAVTVNRFGSGLAYYIGSCLDPDTLAALMSGICVEAGLTPPFGRPPAGVEIVARAGRSREPLYYLLNHTAESITVPLPDGAFVDILTGLDVARAIELPGYGVAVLASDGR